MDCTKHHFNEEYLNIFASETNQRKMLSVPGFSFTSISFLFLLSLTGHSRVWVCSSGAVTRSACSWDRCAQCWMQQDCSVSSRRVSVKAADSL